MEATAAKEDMGPDPLMAGRVVMGAMGDPLPLAMEAMGAMPVMAE
jgi:hypothetical protein